MFSTNKYYIWYQNIINKAKLGNRKKYRKSHKDYVYYEKHHIIPKSLGGNNDANNLVLLTAREHYICHYLLCKFTTGRNKSKMIAAFRFNAFGRNSIHSYHNSRMYEEIRIQDNLIGRPTKGLLAGNKNPFYGKKHNEVSLNKMRGRKFSKEHLDKLRKYRYCIYKVIEPDGVEVWVNNLQLYCSQNNLNYFIMSRIANKAKGFKSHKKYVTERIGKWQENKKQ